jgi:hypothetical protein
MHTYSFQVDDGDGYQAVIAISGNISLHGLAEHIIDTLGFDFDHAFGFYDNLRNPYKSNECYTLFADMDEGGEGELSVQRTLVEEVFTKGRKMIFLFDYGDDWQFLLTCKKLEPAQTKKEVREVLSEKGDKPIQYPDYDDEY